MQINQMISLKMKKEAALVSQSGNTRGSANVLTREFH